MIIYKYKIGDEDVILPRGYKILTCQMQNTAFHVWAVVDPRVTDTVPVKFEVVGTGREFDFKGWTYLNTIQDGSFVWHVWYKE